MFFSASHTSLTLLIAHISMKLDNLDAITAFFDSQHSAKAAIKYTMDEWTKAHQLNMQFIVGMLMPLHCELTIFYGRVRVDTNKSLPSVEPSQKDKTKKEFIAERFFVDDLALKKMQKFTPATLMYVLSTLKS